MKSNADATLRAYLETEEVPIPALPTQKKTIAPQNHTSLLTKTFTSPSSPPASSHLPFYTHLPAINEALAPPVPTLLIGATGCGKSTQLPQHVLRSNPGAVVFVAQPRRLAAISLASRVSNELGSSQLGGTVGYAVRGDTKQSLSTQVLFITYGVLLRMLTSSSSPLRCTHLLLDEVHERSADLDLVLLSLKKQSTSSSSFKTVLMSATVDPSMFSSYLPTLNTVSVPGRTFPVERYYLEHAIADCNYVCGPSSPYARSKALPDAASEGASVDAEISSLRASLSNATSDTAVLNLEGRLAKLLALKSSSSDHEESLPTLGKVATTHLQSLSLEATSATMKLSSVHARSLRTMDLAKIPEDLIAALTSKHSTTADGDVLVFLPGVSEIRSLQSRLSSIPSLILVPLHSNLTPKEQLLAFDDAPRGKTKVILATSVAEASVTVPSITLVIDTSLSRSQTLDKDTGLRALTTSLASKSSIQQRAGRAGRVRAGACYHLFPSLILPQLPASPVPEILTTDLPTLSLRARSLLQNKAGSSKSLLSGLITPPPDASCESADTALTSAGALSNSLSLTAHGAALASLPLALNHATLLLASSRLGCLAEAALVVAGLNATFPLNYESSDATSDHVAIFCAARRDRRLQKGERKYCKDVYS